ncbi:unnamed protein product [Danaus chrysippus]|uniref:(African queen) hypothetical protein n=1 Tax=Danaus chrysippus TaxID=151541 RepID=A0A8J2QI04_9NEOP|nr:unnamed protein product [Danaus chrysippus]
MRLKFFKTLLDAQESDTPVADICWSPNNVKLAVATFERVVLLFDRDGMRRDKFSTKPADAAAGKKSYVITGLAFSDNSELLGVAQSDNMVFVYRIGADWSGKKVICNKFPLTGSPLRLLSADTGFFTGTSDGKIRSLDCKTNKSSSLWSAGSCCVSLARGSEAMLASGHIDGTLYLNGRLILRYTLPPTAMVLVSSYEASQYESMLRLVAAHRPALLQATRKKAASDLRAAGELRAAETYYIQAGENH